MLLIVVQLYILFIKFETRADTQLICSNTTDEGMYFEESEDKIAGRYEVKWCTEMMEDVGRWELSLMSKPLHNCNPYDFSSVEIHSRINEDVYNNLNCSKVCLIKNLDLIFNGTCYNIESSLTYTNGTTNTEKHHDSYHMVTLGYPKEYFTNSSVTFHYQNDGEDIVLDWYLGNIPASDYDVTLWRADNEHDAILMSCGTVSPTHVRCRARAPPAAYEAQLRHRAPWTTDVFDGHFYASGSFEHASTPHAEWTAAEPLHWAALPWLVGGCVAAVAVLLLALLTWRGRQSYRLRRSVLRDWLARPHRAGEEPAAVLPATGVLLLYAPDVARAAEPLRALLRRVTGDEAVDPYCAESVNAAAPAAGAWLRDLLLQPDTRVLLIQSPALALYCSRSDERGAPLAPLMGARAAWRRPHAADPLLRLALRLLSESSAGEPLPYRKYYVASLAGATEALPALTPQRRYLLPGATVQLLRDLAPDAAPPAALLRQLDEALRACARDAADPDGLLNMLEMQ